MLAGGISCAIRPPKGNPYYSGPVSDHFDGLQFFNPQGIVPRGFTDLLRWQFGGGKVKWPARYPSPFAAVAPVERLDGEQLRVTMVGHASLLLQTGGLNILTDPVWSSRASPVSFAGPGRVNPPGIAFDQLPPIDVVLITHNHYDHLDINTLQRLVASHDPLLITPYGNDVIIAEHVKGARFQTGDWGHQVVAGHDVVVHFEPCHHWSARGARDRRMALWCAFVIEGPAGKIYHIGDTGYHNGINYRSAADKHGHFRLANLPIGAYKPRWFMQAQHQNPEEAVRGFGLCAAQFAVGHHWGTFQLTNEGIEEPIVALAQALQQQGVDEHRFRALRPAESWDVPA